MLTKLRESASSWPVKVLLCIVALSFVGWGVGDIFIDRGDTTVAAVGSTDIDIRDLQTAYRNQIRGLQNSGIRVDPGSDLSRLQAGTALDRLVGDTLLAIQADDFGITIGSDTLKAAVAGNEAFHDLNGAFDRALFAGVLSMNGLTEEAYLAALESDLARNQLIGGLVAAPPPADGLLSRIAGYRLEERIALVGVVPDEVLVPPPSPGGDELQRWFDGRKDAYRAPEYRSARFLLVYPEDIADSVAVAPGEVQAAYDSQPGRWRVPERRLVRQVRFETREAAEEAVAGGFDASADGAGARWLERTDLLEEIGGPVFDAAAGEVAGPLQSPLGGWLVYGIDEVAAGSVTPFEEARAALEAELRLAEARYAMFDLAGDLDDHVASGASTGDIASALGLEERLLDRVSSTGAPADPASLQVIPATPGFLDEVFRGEEGLVSTVLETEDGGLLVVEVTDIVPARARTLDEVRREAVEDWQRERRAELAAIEAERLAAGAVSAGSLEDAFRFAGVFFEETGPLMRGSRPGIANVTAATVSALFAAWPGDVVVTRSADGSAQVVARLVDIVPADLSAASAQDSGVGESLRQGVVRDVADLLSAHLREAYPVSVDQGLVEQYF